MHDRGQVLMPCHQVELVDGDDQHRHAVHARVVVRLHSALRDPVLVSPFDLRQQRATPLHLRLVGVQPLTDGVDAERVRHVRQQRRAALTVLRVEVVEHDPAFGAGELGCGDLQDRALARPHRAEDPDR